MSRENTQQVHGADSAKKLVFRLGMSPTESNTKIGPIRSHIYNYAYAMSKLAPGYSIEVIMRIDDTNPEKHTRERAYALEAFYTETIGIHIDVGPTNSQERIGKSVFQSERGPMYKKYVDQLLDKGLAARDTTGAIFFNIEKYREAFGTAIQVQDELKGKINTDVATRLISGMRQFPLTRANQSPLYHLTTTVDDADFGVTHVVRGNDKLSIIDLQEMIRISLGFPPKIYMHLPMLLDKDGQPLKGAVKYKDFLREGILRSAFISYCISSGYGDPEATYRSIDEFGRQFDPRRLHPRDSRYDEARLRSINAYFRKTIDAKVYIASTIESLAACEQYTLLEDLNRDTQLQLLLSEWRRSTRECLEILSMILSPRYTEPPSELVFIIRTVMLDIVALPDELPPYLPGNISKHDYFGALRWILTGQTRSPDIIKIYKYLRDKNLLTERIAQANTILNKSSIY